MGLLDKLLGKQDKTKASPIGLTTKPYIELWPIRTPPYQIIVTGNKERQIYVYDSAPLKGIRKGQVVTVELFRGEGALVSTSTGTFRRREGLNDCIVVYEGYPIGFITFPNDKLRQAAELGFAIKLNAMCYGALEGYKGIKEMRALVPEHFYLHDWIPNVEDDRPIWKRENYFTYNEFDESDYRNLVTGYEWDFPNARIALIPTPEKSKAKPHIGVYAQDGMQISEVSARNGCYNNLYEFAARYASFHVTAKRRVSEFDQKVYYIIEIIGY